MIVSIVLVMLAWLQGAPAVTSSPLSAQAVFERFRKLEGTWTAKSTKGWTEEVHFKSIAGGTVVLETSSDAHPGETMATLYYMDGDRLLLTHYCVARNQPRLKATSIAHDGKDVTFTFLDATNLPSHDKGHMDQVVFHFTDDDHYTSQWTWFENGRDQWLELIAATRKRDATP